MPRLSRWTSILPLLALAACGGGGEGETTAGTGVGGGTGAGAGARAVLAPAPSPADRPEPAGGIWNGTSTTTLETLTFLIGEDGTLRMMAAPTPTAGPAFGAGAVIVAAGGEVSGAYGMRRLQQAALFSGAEACEFTGTLRERSSMTIELECADDSGIERKDSLTLSYDGDYETDSSLARIAGTYTLRFGEQTNVLTIFDDGVVFGSYDNVFACTVNGLVTTIDPAFNLYRVEWQLSGCKPPFARFDGALLTGLATFAPSGAPDGALLVVLTGVVNARLEGVSVLYERI